jgi:hypothetical protein
MRRSIVLTFWANAFTGFHIDPSMHVFFPSEVTAAVLIEGKRVIVHVAPHVWKLCLKTAAVNQVFHVWTDERTRLHVNPRLLIFLPSEVPAAVSIESKRVIVQLAPHVWKFCLKTAAVNQVFQCGIGGLLSERRDGRNAYEGKRQQHRDEQASGR